MKSWIQLWTDIGLVATRRKNLNEEDDTVRRKSENILTGTLISVCSSVLLP